MWIVSAGRDQHCQRKQGALAKAPRDRAQTLTISRAPRDRDDHGREHHLPANEERHREQV
jgi:hypothetical protein